MKLNLFVAYFGYNLIHLDKNINRLHSTNVLDISSKIVSLKLWKCGIILTKMMKILQKAPHQLISTSTIFLWTLPVKIQNWCKVSTCVQKSKGSFSDPLFLMVHTFLVVFNGLKMDAHFPMSVTLMTLLSRACCVLSNETFQCHKLKQCPGRN